MDKHTIMQYFEWYLPADSQHWKRLAEDAEHLSQIGIGMVWMPPAFKATGLNDVGYGIYDLYDLGEFDQKGTIPTKYGTKDDYLEAIQALKQHGIRPIADIVLNHKAGGDELETFQVRKMNPTNRQEALSEPYEIQGWTGFTFPGRQKQYSDFNWHWYHFDGLDYDALHEETGIYQIVGDNKGWADQNQVDTENGNYDYLMFDDIDFKHPDVVAHLKEWAQWFLETTGVTGFRLDAVKHISEDFMADFIAYAKTLQPELYAFGEFWKDDIDTTLRYLDGTNYQYDLVDVGLHMNLYQASQNGADYDLTTIFDGSLVQIKPQSSVTFVENHDTQAGQALQSKVEDWFKPIAYGLILLRQEGLPCVFYGDYYGIEGDFAQPSFQEDLDKLLYLRQHYVYGQQTDYFDHPNCIAWTQSGDEEHPQSLAVVLSNSEAGWKRLDMGTLNAGKTFVDYLGRCADKIVIEEDGWASFPVQGGSISAWIEESI
ncbi:alpha-amylase [Streptococcus caprae]|uniref:Alpha-amylase n=1 Tax=Streptococcus caprae TaxID=1640501 RepID=A0ABV8CYK1_9STRE